MPPEKQLSLSKDFYHDFKEIGPPLVLGLIIISLGLYIIAWLYSNNKDFVKVDKHAPDPLRGVIIMIVLPFAWFFITTILKVLIFGTHWIFMIFEYFVWLLLLILILVYLFDFCVSFSRITRTHALFWYIFYVIGIIGLISIVFGWYYSIPLTFFIIIVVPAMQAEINSFFKRYAIKKEKNIFYH